MHLLSTRKKEKLKKKEEIVPFLQVTDVPDNRADW